LARFKTLLCFPICDVVLICNSSVDPKVICTVTARNLTGNGLSVLTLEHGRRGRGNIIRRHFPDDLYLM